MNLDRRSQILLNFACIYTVWGSTYLAIKYAIAHIPPFLMASSRFIIASLILFAIGWVRRENFLQKKDLGIALVSGLLLVLGNGMVCYAEMYVSSGMAAVVVGTMPVWVMIMNWQIFNGNKPQLRQFCGIALSLIGIILLTQSEAQSSSGNILSWIVLIGSIFVWTLGTLLQRKANLKTSLFMFSSCQLGGGGLIMLMMSPLLDSGTPLVLETITASSVWALAYLILFGTVAAFTSFIWLNRNVDPTLVSTYALVNPVVAVWLGWLFANESITVFTLLFSLIVLVGLYLVIIKPKALIEKTTSQL